MTSDEVFDPLHLDWSGNFDIQAKSLLANVRLTRDEVTNLSRLFFDLQNTLQTLWPGCQIMPFGSIVTGLGICSSDVDCYVYIPNDNQPNQAKCVMLARNLLRKRHWIFQNLFGITTCKVPIVKFFHVPTRRNCDVNFKSPSGVRNSKLIGHLLLMDTRALQLTIIIKYWSKVHKLTGTNLLPNYALSMMTIFYLQHKNVLPPVSLLQRLTNATFLVDDWNTAYGEDYRHQTDNTESLYELIGGFFQFYSKFKYDEFVISPYVGNSVHKSMFANVNTVPNEFDIYKKKMMLPGFTPIRTDKPMCVQDVFEHNRNCTVAVFPRLALRLTLHLQLAAKIYVESSSDYFLREILLKKPVLPKPVMVPRPDVPRKNPNNALNPANNTEVMGKPTNLKRPRETLTGLYNRTKRGGKKRKRN